MKSLSHHETQTTRAYYEQLNMDFYRKNLEIKIGELIDKCLALSH